MPLRTLRTGYNQVKTFSGEQYRGTTMMITCISFGQFNGEIMSGRNNNLSYNLDPLSPSTSSGPNLSFYSKRNRSKQKSYKSVTPLVGKGTGKTDSMVAAKHVLKVNRNQRKRSFFELPLIHIQLEMLPNTENPSHHRYLFKYLLALTWTKLKKITKKQRVLNGLLKISNFPNSRKNLPSFY